MMNLFIKSFLTLVNRFLWSSRNVTRSAPHIRDANNVQRLWNTFVFASIPAWPRNSITVHRISLPICLIILRLSLLLSLLAFIAEFLPQ